MKSTTIALLKDLHEDYLKLQEAKDENDVLFDLNKLIDSINITKRLIIKHKNK